MLDHVGHNDVVEHTPDRKFAGFFEIALKVFSQFDCEVAAWFDVDPSYANRLCGQGSREQAL